MFGFPKRRKNPILAAIKKIAKPKLPKPIATAKKIATAKDPAKAAVKAAKQKVRKEVRKKVKTEGGKPAGGFFDWLFGRSKDM